MEPPLARMQPSSAASRLDDSRWSRREPSSQRTFQHRPLSRAFRRRLSAGYATASAVLRLAGRPALGRVDRRQYNLDPGKVAASINRKASDVLPVHLYDQTTEMERIDESAKEHGRQVMEDAAQAHGTEYDGKK